IFSAVLAAHARSLLSVFCSLLRHGGYQPCDLRLDPGSLRGHADLLPDSLSFLQPYSAGDLAEKPSRQNFRPLSKTSGTCLGTQARALRVTCNPTAAMRSACA